MLDPPSSGTPFIILPGNSWHFMTRHILSMSFEVASPYVLKSHESFTYVSPDVFLVLYKTLIFNTLQEIVRVSFSAPNASQQCGAFLFVSRPQVSAFRPGLHTATVYKQTTLYGRFSVHCSGITLENEPFCRAVYTNPFLEALFLVHIGSVQIQYYPEHTFSAWARKWKRE